MPESIRSHFEPRQTTDLPSTTEPCAAPEGHYWVRAYSPDPTTIDQLLVGKWMIRIQCAYVSYCWDKVRTATESGTLGIGAKVSTDWGDANDPSGPWNTHVICIYTQDWRERDDVLRVARVLHEVDAVRRLVLRYKPDIETYAGRYAGNAPGEVALYECRKPYESITVREPVLRWSEEVLALLRHDPQS